MAVRYYFSTDASAPAISGTAGTLISVLDACLVNGYGSKTGAGWTKAYSGTNLAAYRMSTASPATGFYMRVDDTGTTSARLVGYETMSDVNTGTGPFPAGAQFSGGLFFLKSSAANTTARPWMLIAENRSFYLMVLSNQTAFGAGDNWNAAMFFGDIITRKASDGFNCALIAHTNASTSACQLGHANSISSYAPLDAHYLARDYTGVGGSRAFGKCKIYRTSGVSATVLGATESYQAFPDPISQTWNLGKVMVMESAIVMRGTLPGIYDSIGAFQIGNPFDIIPGQGSLSGTQFVLLPIWAGATAGRPAIQITGDWY